MPSAKPSSVEINALRKKRNLWHPDGHEDHLHVASAVCLRYAGQGYITPAGAGELLRWCVEKSAIKDTYPTCTLVKVLAKMTSQGGWTAEREEGLLRFISAYYIEDPQRASEALADIFERSDGPLGDLFGDIFDASYNLGVTERFVAHTGKFNCGSRGKCFEQLRAMGGTPSDVVWYSDYLFVADEHVKARAMSSKLDHAIYIRARWGKLSILPESVWQQLVEEHHP